jgi:hypothetical protein
LGNSGPTLLAVEGCHSCNCSTDTATSKYDAGTTSINCCRSIPISPSISVSSCQHSCWPSSRFPKDYLETAYYSKASTNTPCFPPTSSTDSYTTLVVTDTSANITITQCTMCFDNKDHSRTYIPAYADHLVILDDYYREDKPKQLLSHSHTTATLELQQQLRLPPNFSFGALIQVMPPEDRIWSNIGIGYNSSFLQQLNITSIYFHLRLHHHHHHHHYKQRRSYLIFNPSKEYYYRGQPVPFEVVMMRKRLHPILGFTMTDISTHQENVRANHTIDAKLNQQKTFWFHIDSGNSGISINDTTIYELLAFVTGGKWHDDDRKASTATTTNSLSTTTPTASVSNHLNTQRLFVPFHPVIAPSLRIWLTLDVFVDIPGPNWVLDKNGTTIFSTYVKNVLGLPFLTSCDFILDDRSKLLFVIKDL